ncbi:MAG TPA: hypothetical protein PKA38_03725 [Candidatus Levybacteria bacterium]|nr:hypothetical protein [Candidatus Levybacteria bacterium]
MSKESFNIETNNEIIGFDGSLPKYQSIRGAVSKLAREEGVSKAMVSKIVRKLGMEGKNLDKEDIAVIKYVRNHPNRGKSGRHFKNTA